MTAAAITAFTDLTFAAFPICVVWNLQMKLSQKIGLALLLGLCLLYALVQMPPTDRL